MEYSRVSGSQHGYIQLLRFTRPFDWNKDCFTEVLLSLVPVLLRFPEVLLSLVPVLLNYGPVLLNYGPVLLPVYLIDLGS